MKLKYFAYFLISAAIFIALFWKVDLNSTFAALQKANVPLIFAGFGVLAVQLVVKGMRWKLFLAPYKLAIRTIDVFSTFLASLLIANVTPARVGEVSRPYFLKKRCKTRFFEIFPIIIFERFLDMVFLLALAFLSLVIFPFQLPELLKIGLIAVLLIMAGIAVILFNRRLVQKVLGFFFSLFHKKLPIENTIASFYAGFKTAKSANLIGIFFFTVLGWLLDALILFIAAASLNVNMPLFFGLGMYAISMVGGAVSSLPGGLGSMEAIMFGFLQTTGLSGPLSLSVVLLYRFISYCGFIVYTSPFLFREIWCNKK